MDDPPFAIDPGEHLAAVPWRAAFDRAIGVQSRREEPVEQYGRVAGCLDARVDEIHHLIESFSFSFELRINVRLVSPPHAQSIIY